MFYPRFALSYPNHPNVKSKKTTPPFETITNKIVGFPDFNGKGFKVFPKEKDD